MVERTYEELMQMPDEEFVEFLINELPVILDERPHLRPLIYQSIMRACPKEIREILKAITSPYVWHYTSVLPQKEGDID